MTTEIERAKALLLRDADARTNDRVAALLEARVAEWTLDPEVNGVVGLVVPATRQAYLVVYVDDEDWEVDEDRMFPEEGMAAIYDHNCLKCRYAHPGQRGDHRAHADGATGAYPNG